MKFFKYAFISVLSAMIIGTSILPIMAVSASVSAHAAILIEAESGEILFAKNAETPLPMASTTKIMTAICALEHADFQKNVIVNEKACGVEGSSIYLSPGETLTMEQLLYAVMLESANDAAAAIAYDVSGGIDEFANLMNETADKIGLNHSHFTNPHGLDNEEHYTTAADLAKLTAYALQNDTFRTIAATKTHQIPLRGDEGVRTLVNHNKLLRLSDDVIGVKTGFTKRSGRCLVSAAERDGVRVIAVTLNAPDDWNDHLLLHELGFGEYRSYTLAVPGQFQISLSCVGAPDGSIIASNSDEVTVCLKNNAEITSVIEANRVLFPPISRGDVVGKVVFYHNGNAIREIPLYSETDVAEVKAKTFKEKITEIFK